MSSPKIAKAYTHRNSWIMNFSKLSPITQRVIVFICVLLGTIVVVSIYTFSTESDTSVTLPSSGARSIDGSSTLSSVPGGGSNVNDLGITDSIHLPTGESKLIHALTWNIAAINNNPFEYWITSDDPKYNDLMLKFSDFITKPGEKDVPIEQVFTDTMAQTLLNKLKEYYKNDNKMLANIDKTATYWSTEYKARKIITGFMTDPVLGKKRLISMPDRVSNTIVRSDINAPPATRPTVINCYNGANMAELSSQDWLKTWLDFMFNESITVKGKDGQDKTIVVMSLLQPILKKKYPSITEEEESISIPLQLLNLAIFDAILVHMLNVTDKTWAAMRSNMCHKLNLAKNDRIINILSSSYSESDVMFLQEVASSFKYKLDQTKLGSSMYDVHLPKEMDTDRDQNSFILLKKGLWTDVEEVTAQVLEQLNKANEGKEKAVGIAKGDLFVMEASRNVLGGADEKYMLASFHGDTNGLATIPVVTAILAHMEACGCKRKLLFGLDANTYASPGSDEQGAAAFAQWFSSQHLNSCWNTENPTSMTTFNARTHLQPQLNKAVYMSDREVKGDKNPKDYILFNDNNWEVVKVAKDNTGKRQYIENMVFPTLDFPSDHGILSAVLRPKGKKMLRTH